MKTFLVIVGLIGVGALGYYAFNENNRAGYRSSHSGTLRDDARLEGAKSVGTSGHTDAAAASYDSETSPALIRELETITGSVDGHELIGRTIDLHVPVLDKANDQAFWVGSKDNRILVVPDRDHRDSIERQRGFVADNGIAAMQAGQQAAISGTIQKLPSVEQMYSWGLTNRDKHDAADRGIYLRADRVSVE